MKSITFMAVAKAVVAIARIRLSEQPIRSAGLVATLGIAILAWIVLAALASPFLASGVGKSINPRLGIVNARVHGDLIPLRYVQQLAAIPGVAKVDYAMLTGLFCPDGKTVMSIGALGGTDVTSTLVSHGASQADIDLWNATRNGLIVGADIAKQCGLTRGMALFPINLFTGVEMPVSIVAVLPEGADARYGKQTYAHYGYVNRMLPESQQDQVRMLSVNGNDPLRLPQLAATIEREFASSDPPLEVNIPDGITSAMGRFGQVQSLLGLVMAAMAACALLVFLTVLTHQIAQRRASMATLQTIGFDRGLQFSGLIMELTLIILAGTALGLLAGHAALTMITPQVFWLTGHLRTPAWALWSLAPALIVLAVLALAWPAVQVSRLKPIDHLRV